MARTSTKEKSYPPLSAHGLESGRKSLKGRLPTPPPSVAMESLWVSLVGNLNLVPCFSSSSSPCHKNRSQRWNGIFLYTLGFSSSSFTFFYLSLSLPVYTFFFFFSSSTYIPINLLFSSLPSSLLLLSTDWLFILYRLVRRRRRRRRAPEKPSQDKSFVSSLFLFLSLAFSNNLSTPF